MALGREGCWVNLTQYDCYMALMIIHKAMVEAMRTAVTTVSLFLSGFF